MVLSAAQENGNVELYVKAGTDEVGIYPSEEGPKLVINREQFSLQDDCWDIEMINGKNSCVFTFYWRGEVKLSVRYQPGKEPFWAAIEAFLISVYTYARSKSRSAKLA
jgi:hypothetical protein